jgi:hypothetical protein
MFLRKIKNKIFFPLVNSIRGHTLYGFSMKHCLFLPLSVQSHRGESLKIIMADILEDTALWKITS